MRQGPGTRYLVALWAGDRFGSTFPFGTLIVNLAGCFALSAVMHTAAALSWNPTVQSAISIGFIGGLTTYSSFNYETTRLLEEGATGAAILNAGGTIVGAFLAGLLGTACARLLVPKGVGTAFSKRVLKRSSDAPWSMTGSSKSKRSLRMWSIHLHRMAGLRLPRLHGQTKVVSVSDSR